MYIYHALINALSAHMIHINLNIFYTHVEHSPIKTIYIKYYKKDFYFLFFLINPEHGSAGGTRGARDLLEQLKAGQ